MLIPFLQGLADPSYVDGKAKDLGHQLSYHDRVVIMEFGHCSAQTGNLQTVHDSSWATRHACGFTSSRIQTSYLSNGNKITLPTPHP